LRVVGLNAEEEAVPGFEVKTRGREEGVVEARQAVEREHAQSGAEGRAQDGDPEPDHEKGRVSVERTAAHVDGIGIVRVDLDAEADDRADDAADQPEPQHALVAQAQHVAHAVDRERRERLDMIVACTRCASRR
jgi:hypothetical protein